MDRNEIAAVLASAGMKPRHQFGQNFMVDQNILRAIAAAGDIGPNDVVLEVGPGVGNLTRLLSEATPNGAVLAVDIDRHLLPAAQRHHQSLKNITWLLADVLAGKHAIEPAVLAALAELKKLHPAGELKLISNLPYNAASPLIAELLVAMWRALKHETENSKLGTLFFSRLTFTVQWEVAQRMAAAPNTRDYGPLGVLIQSMADVEILRKIPPGAFWPPPKIHSALVVVTPRRDRIQSITDAPAFQQLLAGIFGHRRQTLANALKHYLAETWTPDFKRQIAASGFDLSLRPEIFPVAELLRLAQIPGIACRDPTPP
ncbi:MAG TPA: 16S rRNA (adenine(1518)-N(6)/adenine(1519)-N(6))-dimethyltransferase RsmA [Phycisphaerae bacterium]|jgi:16S rRNA (adenine1518-N6/adenine1519-N6)-dimethyltransferase